jgi:hypothetical protein
MSCSIETYVDGARGRVCLERGPSACTGQPILGLPAVAGVSAEELFEVENDSGGNADIVLRLRISVGDFRQMRQQIVKL